MEESSLSNSHSNNADPSGTSSSNHPADVSGVNGSVNGAKYRLMSPAKLPISRSPCITIPPGLSPTSFLESPVLLSNIKAEPSPTTGSFFQTQLMQSSGANAALPLENSFSRDNITEENNSSSFEFRFHTGTSSTSGLSHSGMMIHAGLNLDGRNIHQNQRHSQTSVPSSAASQSLVVGMQDSLVCSTTDQSNEESQPDVGVQVSSSEIKDSISSVPLERTSDDGYNWRKYGQKLVKGSEFPRSYYKCTYPNCEVKKIFERSPSGLITEIIYKGSHNHPKPQPARRNNPGTLLSIQDDKLDKDLSFSGQLDKLNANSMEQNDSAVLSPLQGNEDGDGSASQYQGSNNDLEDDDPFLKRRKMEDGIDVTPVVKPIREPRVVVQTVSEVDILDDGYRWRKYGQKVVRGNPNPRSYYKCTYAGCPVRKHVERASHDPKAVITTYEGKHNHDVPTAKNTSHELASSTMPSYNHSRMQRPNDTNNSISLDLGVGINRRSNDQQIQSLDNEDGRSQVVRNNPGIIVVQSSQVPIGYGMVNRGLNLYHNSENRIESHNFHGQPNLGRIIMGP